MNTGRKEKALEDGYMGMSHTHNEEEMEKLLHEFKEHDASKNTQSIR